MKKIRYKLIVLFEWIDLNLLALFSISFTFIRAIEEFSIEKLNADYSKNELE